MVTSPHNYRCRLPRSLVRCGAALLVAAALAPVSGGAETADAERLARLQGDYEVSVYPQAFGFFVEDGTMFLRMGGVASDGQAAPLIEEEPGRFVLSPGHPNAFGLEVVEGEVQFTLYSMGTPIPGRRVGQEEPVDEATARADPEEKKVAKTRPTRSHLLDELGRAAADFDEKPGDDAGRRAYARLLYQAGEFARAATVAAPLLKQETPRVEDLDLAGDLAYLLGDYERAESLYQRLVEARANDPAAQVMAKVDLMFTYYQSDRFREIQRLDFPAGVQLPTVDLISTFDADPYGLEWDAPERTARVGFLTLDPLPLLTLEVEDRIVHVLLDTGADMLILDDQLAAALGVEQVARAMGTFGGGLRQEIGFGRVGSVRLGQVTVRNVPITILPTERFSSSFAEGRYKVGGILGTALLRQFLSTVDYANGQLVLRERSPAAAAALREELAGRLAARVPFALSATHLIMARGGLDAQDDLTFFIDSGLASEAAFAAPAQTLAELGIAEPERRIPEEGVGGGGGKFATGQFPIQRLALGSLEQTDLLGEFGPLEPSTYWARGFIQDGLLSHRFLSRYASWTLDFDAMELLFAAPPG